MNSRADVDGLRALAVLVVVLFHAQLPWFGGGFVGVDVFFVISGYLITGLLVSDLETQRFSIARFDERRIRRIFPALLVVLVAAAVCAWFWLLPDDLRRFGASLAAMALFVSNMLFWSEAGYFDGPSESKPLLHTWSLSVEEQFYVLFPPLLALLFRYGQRTRAAFIVGGALLSFILSVVAVERAPGAAYYLAPTRVWELLHGSVLAVGLIPPVTRRVLADGLAVLGLALIVGSVLLLSPASRFPGVNALYPCLGAALLIHSGERCRTAASRVLSLQPIVFVGLISYSLYLWHWVVLVFARYNSLTPLKPLATGMAIAASFALAVLSWWLVEKPVRRQTVLLSRRTLFGTAAAATLALAGLGALLWASGGMPDRLPDAARQFAAGSKDTWPRHRDCERQFCTLGGTSGQPAPTLLWGDSHAAVLAPAFERPGAAPVVIAFDNGCPPLLGVLDHGRPEVDCPAFADRVLQHVQAGGIRRVVLHARWALYVEGTRLPHEAGKPVYLSARRDAADNAAAFAAAFDATLKRLHAMNVETIVLTSVPEHGRSVLTALAQASLRGVAAPSLPVEDFQARQARAFPLLRQAAAAHGAQMVDLFPVLCPGGNCALQEGGRALYSDDDHLSRHGVARISDALDALRRPAAP